MSSNLLFRDCWEVVQPQIDLAHLYLGLLAEDFLPHDLVVELGFGIVASSRHHKIDSRAFLDHDEGGALGHSEVGVIVQFDSFNFSELAQVLN